MDKEEIKKEFNQFLDSASDETIKDFLQFLKDRKAKKSVSQLDFTEGLKVDPSLFKNRAN